MLAAAHLAEIKYYKTSNMMLMLIKKEFENGNKSASSAIFS